MNRFWKSVERLVVDDRAQDLLEYALLASFVALVVIVGASTLGTALNNWYSTTATTVNSNASSAS
jgi:pilus assembly protein Flp/PilA